MAVSEGKGIFITHKGRMGGDGIAGFLGAVSRKKATKFEGGKLPELATTDAWDGEDGEQFEEEFDLADLMGDDEDEL